jgi:hypothetical protein
MARDDRAGDGRGEASNEDDGRRSGRDGDPREPDRPEDGGPRRRDRGDRPPGGGRASGGSRESRGNTVRRLLAGGVGGAVTFVVGWMVTLTALSGSFVREGNPIPMFDQLFEFGRVPEWKAAFWYFHGGHFGQMQRYGTGGSLETGTYQNHIRMLIGDSSHLVSFLLPIVLLLVAGGVLAWILGADETGRGVSALATSP